MTIRVGIIGVGNCAKSLVEGAARYSTTGETAGLAFPVIGGYHPADIEFVLAYDVDERKVGRPLAEAVYALPNCAVQLAEPKEVRQVCCETVVRRGSLFDGVAKHMEALESKDDERYWLARNAQGDTKTGVGAKLVGELKEAQLDAALLYLPVGSAHAMRFYVAALLEAKVPFVNCIPEFIVSSPWWADRIREAGIPAIGDDMRSQVGASVLSQVLQEMFLVRGATVKFHCQTNAGGNTDFHNMLDRSRLASKKISKEGVITSQSKLHGAETPKHGVHAGPADYIPYLKDNKVATIRIEAEGFGGVPITLDCRLSVQDSPNSAGVVIDAVRYLKVAREKGMVGPLEGVCAYTQKTPPRQMTLADAYAECKLLAGV